MESTVNTNKEEYKKTLIDGLSHLEKGRLKRIFWAYFLSIGFGALCYLYIKLAGLSDKTLGPIMFITVLPYIIITEKYKLDIQKKVMKLFTAYFQNFNFCDNECIPDFKLGKSGLFNFTDNYSYTCFSGEVNNKKTTTSLCKLSIKEQSTGKKEVSFKGIVSMTILPMFYSSLTIIINNCKNPEFGALKRVDTIIDGVYSNNEQEAQMLLTPQIIEWFNSLKTTFKTEKYAISLTGNTLIVAVYDENLECFEYKGTYQKVYFSQKMQTIFEALEKLLEVNYLEFPQPLTSESTQEGN